MPANVPWRLQRLFGVTSTGADLPGNKWYRCDIYKPTDPVPVATGDIEARDTQVSYTKIATNVKCYYEATPDTTSPQIVGRTGEKNQNVVSKWHFFAGQEVEDSYLLVMTGPVKDKDGNPNPYLGLVWMCESNKTLNFSLPGRPTDSQWIPALLSYSIKAEDL